MTQIEIKPLNNAIVKKFYRQSLPMSIRGYAAMRGDDVLAIAGIKRDGRYNVFFSEIAENIEVPKITVWRIAKKIVTMCNKDCIAIASKSIPNASKFLRSLGFSFAYSYDGQEVFAWHKH